MNYYNEHDPKAAAWLRELISAGLIPAGDVDTRSITEVSPDEIAHYTQCHFFAGIGGWSLALELAGWPATRPVWTGSCPCQPFSSAGQGKGGGDDRHLWPVFRRLVAKLHPERVFGEQVAQAIGFNWLDGVSADLEADGYAVGAAVLGAHSVGAPHIRQRLYWVADAKREGLERLARNGDDGNQPGRVGAQSIGHAAAGSKSLWLANSTGRQRQQRIRPQGNVIQRPADDGTTGGVDNAAMPRLQPEGQRAELREQRSGECVPSEGCANVWMGDASGGGCGVLRDEAQPGSGGYTLGSSWARFEVVHCRDGKARRFEPGSFPLADGLPGRVGLLRGYGNAIVPQTAAEFIMACDEILTANTQGHVAADNTERP
jgi:DNA (cytosine-5)-methyltransferase 1